MDLKKDPNILFRAYNDTQGVTAKFNKNMLLRINKAFNADFDLNLFRHRAIWNSAEGRIEMHLESLTDQTIHIKALGMNVSFREGETIHTENSHKYSLSDIEDIAAASGFYVAQQWFDQKQMFSLNLFVPTVQAAEGS